jgi:hypothetical protein
MSIVLLAIKIAADAILRTLTSSWDYYFTIICQSSRPIFGSREWEVGKRREGERGRGGEGRENQ